MATLVFWGNAEADLETQRDRRNAAVRDSDRPSRTDRAVQLKRDVAGMDIEAQREAIRPPRPLMARSSGTRGGHEAVQLASGTGSTAHPKAAELAADKALIKPIASLKDYQGRIKALKVIVRSDQVPGVSKKLDKFFKAVDATKMQLVKPPKDGYGPSGGAAKIKEFIDDRVAIVMGYLSTNYIDAADKAHKAITASGKVEQKDQFSPDWGVLVDFKKGKAAFDPEERFDINDLKDINGIFKVYDVGKIFRSMGATYKAAWDAVAKRKGVASGRDLFVQECKTQDRLVFAPKGEGKNPPFAGANGLKVFAGEVVEAFVGLGRDGGKASTFAEALTVYALNKDLYPSKVMLAVSCDNATLKSRWGGIKFGKPSIMYLLAFDENTYDEKDRTFGHLADPKDPEKPGATLELSMVGLPMSDFMKSATSDILA